jgi:A/G-specific adenine glycosylase
VHLHRLAQEIVQHGWPACDATALQHLPGVGPYTANALLAYAFGMDAPVVDTNVRRVLAYAIYKRPAIMRMSIRCVMELASRVIPDGQGRDWNFALMDYGALVLTAREVQKWPTPGVGHHAERQKKAERFEGSSRFWRGRIVAVLRSSPRVLTIPALRSHLTAFGAPPDNLRSLLSALTRDGIVSAIGARYRLPTT